MIIKIKNLWVGWGAFYKQFDKIVKLIDVVNYTNQKFIKSQINNFFAFSLIELSIVLIIIGLLVAGVTGGASLIESAKITNFISTTRDWQNDVYTFYSLKNRLPGNLDNSYYLGQFYNSNYDASAERKYKLSDFGINDYDGLGGDAAVSYCAAFWLDLYLAKITDFKPASDALDSTCPRGSSPLVFNGDLRLIGPKTINFADNNGRWPQFQHAMRGIYFQFVPNDTHVKPRIYYHLDQKIDDGVYNTGSMRGFCYSNRTTHDELTSISYQEAMNLGYTCYDFYYKLLDYNLL